ncbi:RcnB family protein [Sphingomonas sp. SUN019]|uniref:RcnB family protein n=1 Tax=Sphingomonas sp. SUN019 TaxID=2937788 RepID=UPI0021643950|nr:RcnB family protein [Sphingomonas sp. SUN019]UVO49454.1 RcnB family protein [Sphingomonas sp. SUN019]
MLKKIIQATLAASLVATPLIAASAAEAQTRQVTTVKQRPNGTIVQKTTIRQQPRANYRQWNNGQRFDRRYAQNYRVVDYRRYRTARLYAPPRGQYWARSGRDAVLVTNGGVVKQVIRNIRW